jgi:hypothetical protein
VTMTRRPKKAHDRKRRNLRDQGRARADRRQHNGTEDWGALVELRAYTGPWYHGGVPGLGLGAEVLPPSRTGRKALVDYAAELELLDEATRRSARDRVFVTRDLGQAVLFAALFVDDGALEVGGSVYRVEPKAPLELDPDWQGEPGVSAMTVSATVVEVVEPRVSIDLSRP